MSEFKPIASQEELDRIIGERLSRQKEKFSDYDQLKVRVAELETENGGLRAALDESKTKYEGEVQKTADLEKQVAGYETAQLRQRVAIDFGLPLDLADRLTGDDEAGLRSDAERLAGYFKQAEPLPPFKDLEPTTVDAKDAAWLEVAKNL